MNEANGLEICFYFIYQTFAWVVTVLHLIFIGNVRKVQINSAVWEARHHESSQIMDVTIATYLANMTNVCY